MSNEKNTANQTRQDEAISRRRVVKLALATAPIIATLPTGAALARSSNLISATTNPAGALDANGRTLCLNANSGTMLAGNTMDLGRWPHGTVTAIKQRDYRVGGTDSAAGISEAAMCQKGGTFYYQQTSAFGYQQVNVPRGMMVSWTAMSSFAGSIRYTDV
jgi:hypothetical protein